METIKKIVLVIAAMAMIVAYIVAITYSAYILTKLSITKLPGMRYGEDTATFSGWIAGFFMFSIAISNIEHTSSYLRTLGFVIAGYLFSVLYYLAFYFGAGALAGYSPLLKSLHTSPMLFFILSVVLGYASTAAVVHRDEPRRQASDVVEEGMELATFEEMKEIAKSKASNASSEESDAAPFIEEME